MTASRVHPTAVIHPEAHLHPSVEVGPYAVIGARVRIGADSVVGPHTVIDGDTTLGERNRISPFASIGGIPQDLKYAGEPSRLVVGDDNQIREFTTLHIGTAGGGGVTRIGNQNLFMANSHVAHDSVLGNRCVVANSVAIAGHVEIGDFVTLGGLSAVHQFCRVGDHAFLAGGSMVTMDVAPYCTVQGDRAELSGLNTVGLSRNGFSEAQIGRVKEAYKLLFRSGLVLAEAIARIREEVGTEPEIDRLLIFVESSKRGIIR